MPPSGVERLRVTLRIGLVAIYIAAGLLHLLATGSFAAITPPAVPFARQVVLFTGVCEFAGALGLLIPSTRRWAGIMLALYAVCVWPANIYQAFWHVRTWPVPDSWWYHGPRIAFQPVLVWWALFAAGVIDWPYRGARTQT
jgi:uncharacterized membrane protein